MPNYNYTVESSSARTATGTGQAQSNRDCMGAVLAIKVSAVSGTSPTLTVKVQGSANGTDWYDINGAVTATINSVSTVHMTVRPGVTAVANVALAQPIPRFWRVAWTIGGTSPSFTFSVDAAMLI